MIDIAAEQKRCVREVSSSKVFTSLGGASASDAGAEAEAGADESQKRSPALHGSLTGSSMPIASD